MFENDDNLKETIGELERRNKKLERVLEAGKRVVASYDNWNVLFRNTQLAVSIPELEEEIRRAEKE